MELSEGDLIDKEGQEQSEGEEAASGPIFQPLRDDSVGCFSEHKGQQTLKVKMKGSGQKGH